MVENGPSDEPGVPQTMGELPDGREALITGGPLDRQATAHLQGDNRYGFEGTCGLVSCQDVLTQLGIVVTEDDLVHYAVTNDRCYVSDDPSLSGGTTPQDLVQVLDAHGVPAHNELNGTLAQLAAHVESATPCIIGVNAGILWDSPNDFGSGEANHAVVVTGMARDPFDERILGFYINDSGVSNGGAQFVDVETIIGCWVDSGGQSIIVDTPR